MTRACVRVGRTLRFHGQHSYGHRGCAQRRLCRPSDPTPSQRARRRPLVTIPTATTRTDRYLGRAARGARATRGRMQHRQPTQLHPMLLTHARSDGTVKLPEGDRHVIHGERVTAVQCTHHGFQLGDGICGTDYYAEGLSFRNDTWFAHLCRPHTGRKFGNLETTLSGA